MEQKVFMTMPEAEELSRDLAGEILAFDRCPDLLVGLANGALLPTKIVADQLAAPFEMVQVRRQGSRYKQILLSIKDTLRIPTGLITAPPLMVLWRFLQKRTAKLEHSDNAFAFDVCGKYVVIVDDAIHTGNSVRYVEAQLLRQGAAKVRIAVLCWYEGIGDSGEWGPEIYLHRKDQYYPWSNNSPYLKQFLAWLPVHGLTFWR
jgi:hypoxanthine phosphoribosyltransferase